jgi:hypothetical protein
MGTLVLFSPFLWGFCLAMPAGISVVTKICGANVDKFSMIYLQNSGTFTWIGLHRTFFILHLLSNMINYAQQLLQAVVSHL